MTVQKLTTARMAQIYGEMIAFRREFRPDTQFFKMTEFWDWLCNGSPTWKIKLFRSNLGENYARRAGVVAFGERATLTVDVELWDRAAGGCKVANFILAHEVGHLGLNHHAKNAVTKNFKLFIGPSGDMANLPPTVEELEANFAAVFLQCGVALEDRRWTAVDLSNRAFADLKYVKRAQEFVRLEIFQRELLRPKPKHPRVIL